MDIHNLLCGKLRSAHDLWMAGISLKLSLYNLLYMMAILFMVNVLLIKWLINRAPHAIATYKSSTANINNLLFIATINCVSDIYKNYRYLCF